MARVIIVDAGPLIAFATIDQLQILQQLFSRLRITASVRDECLALDRLDSQRIAAAIQDGWLIVEPASQAATAMSPSLGRGESDSIHLARQDPAQSLLIMDDRLARRYALRQGLQIVGSVRLLDLAERRGMIGDAKACIAQMAALGYRVSPDLLDKIRNTESDQGSHQSTTDNGRLESDASN